MNDDPFSDLPDTAVRLIQTSTGDVLFRQAEPVRGLYRVQRGCVTLRRTTVAGDTLTLHRATTGDLFAEASVFSDQYHCDAICAEGGEVQHISKAAVLDQLSKDKDFALAFTALLARQVQSYRFLLEITAIKSAEERVLAAVSAGYLDGAVTEFATRVHLTHEACYRALRALCNKGRLTQLGRGQYQLLNQPDRP
ncbi:Crp/Fnr family transcriptional regulator [Aliiroseovarius sp. YM-037]|uniref:Crp/Fnr family transcriptional regulator n=1 Tax=Aliiroseovarius sp. YM-037 TaxID=3341728 RepID=UPI003A7FF246